jgi:hypothetical protein
MIRWTALVAVFAPDERDAMMSRLPTLLHPVCGRPLVWHAVSTLFNVEPAPERVLMIAGDELPDDLFQHAAGAVVTVDDVAAAETELDSTGDPGSLLVIDAAMVASPDAIASLLSGAAGSWLPADDGSVAAVRVDRAGLVACLGTHGLARPAGEPSFFPGPASADSHPDLDDPPSSGARALVVRDRRGLAAATREIRDQIVGRLMEAGVTFVLPESVAVDVDVRIGRDTVVYPGAILEGETTIGEETVIGPGCRIISSWIGSGVEMKGWNYIAHTSIRNRAILEPYVRRGFD